MVDKINKNFTFILEAGVNHDGDLGRARQLIREAAQTGADFIKFQTYTANKIAAKISPSYWDLSEEPTTSQIELFSKYDGFTRKDYISLSEEAESCGIGFMTTCFDKDWVDELDPIISQYKIASADITNFQLISHIASKDKPILLSTGAATFEEIRNALDIMREKTKKPISILHCVLNYPTSAENASLERILLLKKEFPGFEIGYSDHTKPDDSAQSLQIALNFGATVFEKHFTWDVRGAGNDHYHSFGVAEARKVIQDLQKSELLSHYNEQRFIENQIPARIYARRGLYAAKDVQAGHIITESDIIPLRPPLLLDGFGGDEFFDLIGKKVLLPLSQGEAFTKSNLN
jgi:N-acetylneuraminate synthase